MNRRFKHRGLKQLFLQGHSKKIGPQFADRVLRVLDILASAETIKDLNIPGMDFNKLRGHNPARYSMHVNGNYCITFAWVDGEPIDIDFEDYH
jgi:proteic killer suppression protein